MHDNPSRDAILSRIRSALATPAPPCAPISSDIALFPPIGDLLQRLQTELAASLVDCVLTTDAVASAIAIQERIRATPRGEVFVQDTPILRDFLQTEFPNHTVRWSRNGVVAAEHSVATVTLCEILVASSGSIVVSAACGGRNGSILAPCHIVYARTRQIVPDLSAAMDYIYKAGMLRNSFIGFQTGASRTGDIEKILVHGAHGPRKVILVLQQ